MRRRVIPVILCLLLVGGGVALYLRGVSPAFVLWRARQVFPAGGHFIEADINTKLYIGPLKPSVTLHVKHMDAMYDVIAADDVAFYSAPAPGFIVYPASKVVIQLESGPEASSAFGQLIQHWGGGQVRSLAAEAGNLRLGPPSEIEGKACWAVEYPNPLGAPSEHDSSPQKLPFLPISLNWKTIAEEVKTARVYVERGSGVPVQVEFLDAKGEPVIVNTIRNLRVENMATYVKAAALSGQNSDFAYHPPAGYKVIRRTVDPKDPWKAFLPPESASAGSYLLNKLRERLEKR